LGASVHKCQEPSCGYENDDGARFCAHCGRQLSPKAAPALRLRGRQQIRDTLAGAAQLSLPEGLNPIHAGRTAGQTQVVAADERRSRVYLLHGRFGGALSLEEVQGDWPAPRAWLRPPVYTPLTTALASADRVVWRPARRNLANGPLRSTTAGGGERFVGFGPVDDVWLALARRTGRDTLSLEVGSGDGPGFTTLATLHGPVPEDAAVLLGGAPWLADLARRAEAPADSDYLLAGAPGAARLPVAQLWAIVGSRLLLLDVPNDRILADLELDAPALAQTYIARRRAGALEPVVLGGRNAGLYLNLRDPDQGGSGLRPGFVPARLPLRATPLQAATPEMQWDRLADLVARPDGAGAVYVDPGVIVPYAGTQPGEAESNPVGKNFQPVAAPGFVAGFVEASLGPTSDGTSSKLLIYRTQAQGQELSVHANEPLADMPVETALPPVFTGEELQLIGRDERGLKVILVPVAAGAAAE
jgi:hypothetical protein